MKCLDQNGVKYLWSLMMGNLQNKADYEEGTWTPQSDLGSPESSVYKFTNATYKRIGNIVILHTIATAKAEVHQTTAELHVFAGSFPYPVDKILNLFAFNKSSDLSKIGTYIERGGQINFGNFNFGIESQGATDVDISIIYTLK